MDVTCDCGEPWNVYGIVHDEGLLEHLEKLPKEVEQETIEFDKYLIFNYCGYNEIPEGHFKLLKCPCCNKGTILSDGMKEKENA
jgi:hypothetical protein